MRFFISGVREGNVSSGIAATCRGSQKAVVDINGGI